MSFNKLFYFFHCLSFPQTYAKNIIQKILTVNYFYLILIHQTQRTMKAKQQYTVTWGDGFSQSNLSISEAIKIVRDLINEYPSVTLSKKII